MSTPRSRRTQTPAQFIEEARRRSDLHVALRDLAQRVEARERAGLHSPAEIEEERRVLTWLARVLEREERPHE